MLKGGGTLSFSLMDNYFRNCAFPSMKSKQAVKFALCSLELLEVFTYFPIIQEIVICQSEIEVAKWACWACLVQVNKEKNKTVKLKKPV
ncbi:hypothetical protein L1987_16445 [Smallanthus sonchifolius]|uniref:Uncharacterized protein n=1 Tax=Smallanthus sonchifolius TaxID=185202 RepID=A0ACB9J9C6_9ASTR|nr:hypothetical protein L1987_16445 [Smallanthus sonchifolius]